MSETPLIQLARFASGIDPAALPQAVRRSIRERMLDTIGLCLAAGAIDTSGMARRVALEWGGRPEATVFGFGDRLPPAAAAFVNGTLAHSLDFDDTHLPSVLHPSASIVPGLMAVAERTGAGTAEFIAAAAAAYEICVRTGMAAYDRELGNSVFFERGWHATSICGTLGVAGGAARLLGLGEAGISHAVAIAASMGSGIIEANRAGGSVKRLHCGWAAHAGITAAQCAANGITGPASVFEGRFGFYQAFCGGAFDERELTTDLGEVWCIPGIFFKPYPANHFTHAAIDAALALKTVVAVDEIEEVSVGAATATLRTIAEPRAQKINPATGYQAQFSGPFAVAAAFIGGGGLGLGLDDFTDEKANNPAYRALASRVTFHADPDCDRIFPNQFAAVMRVRTTRGETFEQRVMANRGGPGNPLSIPELRAKFEGNAAHTLSGDEAARLARLILDDTDRPVAEIAERTVAVHRKVEV
jgi:2-methylcitrate dehydratase PrpD